MKTVLILYPRLFACQAKFERKLEKITRDLSAFNIMHGGDPNGFIDGYFDEDQRVQTISKVTALDDSSITHAVVFDDGEEFDEARQTLVAQGIPLRWIKVALTRVVNIKREPQHQNLSGGRGYEYIGRGSYWGNPHAMESGESREEVIRKYEYDFTFNKFLNIDPSCVHELAGKRLGCFCKPALCHGDVLADYLNNYDDGS